MTARHQLRSSTLAPAQRFSLRSVLRPPLRLLLAAIWLAAPIPAVEPQLHRHDGRRLAEPVAATQLQEGGSFSLSLSVSVSLCV